MQGPRLGSGSAGAKLASDAFENNTKTNFQHSKLATYRDMASWPRSSGGLYCQQQSYQRCDN